MTANKVPSGSTDPKAGVAVCFVKTSSAYNGTPAQPQSQAMGAARRDPRRGSIPGVRRPPQFRCPPWPGEVVSNTGSNARARGPLRKEQFRPVTERPFPLCGRSMGIVHPLSFSRHPFSSLFHSSERPAFIPLLIPRTILIFVPQGTTQKIGGHCHEKEFYV